MLISCSHCGRIHEDTFICKDKEEKASNYKRKVSEADRFRWTSVWQKKRREINERDNFMCQICVRERYETRLKYNYEDISVHHVIPIVEDWEQRLVDSNLICLCSEHHKLAEDGDIGVGELRTIISEQEETLDEKNSTPLLLL